MPTGIYARTHSPAIAKAAKARGQTGFLHPRRTYKVRANGILQHVGHNRRDADRTMHRIRQNGRRPTLSIV